MSDPFVHLRVASAYSMRYGASQPHTLVERAAEYEMDLLGLTDRDGLYGAIRFVQACRRFRIGAIVGVDLALARPRRPHAVATDAGPRRRRPGARRQQGLRPRPGRSGLGRSLPAHLRGPPAR